MDMEKLKALLQDQVEAYEWSKKNKMDHGSLEYNYELLEHILNKDYDECIVFLNECSQEEIEVLAPIFEELSYAFKRQEFVDFIEKLQKKFPDLDIEFEVQGARDAVS